MRPNTNGHCRTSYVHSNSAPQPVIFPSLSASVGPARTNDNAARMYRHTEREPDGDESDLPPRASLIDLVRAVECPDDREERRRTAPQRTRDTEREESTALIVGQPSHVLLDQCEDLQRDERTEGSADIVGDVRERKELASARRNRIAKQREEEVTGQLSREAENISIDDFGCDAAPFAGT